MTNKIDELKQMEAFKELLEVKITGLKEEIESEKQEEKNTFPKHGDDFYCIDENASIFLANYVEGAIDVVRKESIGNCFRTQKEAEFEVERLKVLKELKEFSTKFERNGENYYLVFWANDDLVGVMLDAEMRLDVLYFASAEKAQEAIEAVGEDRIIKYYFGIEE